MTPRSGERPGHSDENGEASGGARALVIPVAALSLVIAVVAAAVLWSVGRQSGADSDGGAVAGVRSSQTNDYGPAPHYTLTDQTGEHVSSARFAGTVQVVAFLFPYCTTDCPILAPDLAQLQHTLAAEHLGDKVAIVTFNVDPGGAGPKQPAEFLGQYGAMVDPATATAPWYYLTGSRDQVRRVVRDGYHVEYWKTKGAEEGAKQPNKLANRVHPDYDIKHQDIAFVVDGTGRIRDLYDGAADIQPGALLDAVHRAMR